jgi:hypothetical protein
VNFFTPFLHTLGGGSNIMLIRSSFVSLVLTAALTSAANCESSAEAPADDPGPAPVPLLSPTPEPTPTSTPTPDPTPDPVPETPKRVNLELLPEQSACGAVYKAETESSGVLHIDFNDLISEAAQGKYRAVCRLAGSLVIPKGYKLDPSVTLTAVVKGELKGGIDNVTGRLKLSLGRYTSRDFEVTEYQETEPNSPAQTVKLDLKTQLPELPTSCTEDLDWAVSLFVESTINGKASSRIEEMKLDSLVLMPIDCEP